MADTQVRMVDWETCDALRVIRQAVFIDEQRIEPELEWDADDRLAVHFLLTHGGHAAGTARLLADGHIGRVAILRAFRGVGLGERLMRDVMDQARRLGHQRFLLSAQTYAQDFYRRLGFETDGEEYLEAGIAHVAMVWEYDPQNLPPIDFASPGRFRIHNPEEAPRQRFVADLPCRLGDGRESIQCDEVQAHHHACHMAQQVRRELLIQGADQAAWLFNQRDFIDSCEQLIATRSRCRIRVLLQDVPQDFTLGHSLVKLAHRFPSMCDIRRVHPELARDSQVYMLADDDGIFMLPRKQHRAGFVRYQSPDQVRRWAGSFEELWSTSRSDPALRRFLL
jgi:predicted GNAT family N-acyltransferase